MTSFFTALHLYCSDPDCPCVWVVKNTALASPLPLAWVCAAEFPDKRLKYHSTKIYSKYKTNLLLRGKEAPLYICLCLRLCISDAISLVSCRFSGELKVSHGKWNIYVPSASFLILFFSKQC